MLLPDGCGRYYCCCAAILAGPSPPLPPPLLLCVATAAAAHTLLRVFLKCAVFVSLSYATRGFVHILNISCFPYCVLEVALHGLHGHVSVDSVQDVYFSAFRVAVFLCVLIANTAKWMPEII